MASDEPEPIHIEGVVLDEIGKPRQDGTRGSALYSVPLKLNRTPTHEWARLFVQAWDHPSEYTMMHRPGIASVQGDRVILVGTTIEELRDVHRSTLKLAVEEANAETVELARQRGEARRAEEKRTRDREEQIRKVNEDLNFD